MGTENRLSTPRVILFGSGNAGINLVNILVQTWLFYFLDPGTGRTLIPAAYIGSILMFGRIIDAVSDPIIGNWSDRLRSKHGRRIPFLALSALPLILISFLIFFEPSYAGSMTLRVIVLALLLGLFYILFTAFAAPYLGMIPDLSPARDDRVNLSTSSAVFNLMGTAIALIAMPLLLEFFAREKGTFDGMAFIPSTAIIALLALGTFVLTIVGVFPYRNRGEGPTENNILESMKMVFKNRPFMVYLFGMNIFWGGFFIVNVSVPYYVTVLMGKTIGFQSTALGITFGVAAVSFPLINLMLKHLGNRLVSVITSAVMTVALIFIFFVPNPPLGLSPAVFGMILMGITGFPISALFILPQSMIAELSDFRLPDGSKPGEAIYFGVQGLVLKFFVGVSSLVASILFDVFGNTVERPLGIQLTGPVVSSFALFALILFLFFYPDDRKGLHRPADI